MKYWGYLAAKLTAALLFLWGVAYMIGSLLPAPREVLYIGNASDALGQSILLMVFGIFSSAVLAAIVLDHRYRCRTCFRRLRMPLTTGTWNKVLLSRPRTEYICPYGHGTLKVEELQITGHSEPDWQPHEDMWKELAKK